MNSSVVLLVLLSALLHASWNFICKSQKPSAAFFTIATSSSVVAMTPLYLHFAPRYQQVPPMVWGLMVVTGFCQAVYFVGLANAYRLHDISFVYPIARALPVLLVPAVCALVGYGEPLRTQAVLGMAVIVLGCLILPLRSWKFAGLKQYRHPALLFVFVAAVGTTGYTVIDSYALSILKRDQPLQSDFQSALFYIAFENLFVLIFIAAYMISSQAERAHFRSLKAQGMRFPICSGLTCTVAYTLILIAMQHASNVSYVTALRQVSILLGVLMGVFWLREKAGPFKMSGVGLILAGLVLTVIK